MEWIKLDPEDTSTWPPEGKPLVYWYNEMIDYGWREFTYDMGYVVKSPVSGKLRLVSDEAIVEYPAVYCWAEIDMPDWLKKLEEEEPD